MGDNSCVVCGHREAADSYVCTLDQQRLDEQLDGLGGKVQRLAVELTPGGAAPASADRVNLSRTNAPPPARMDILTLLGPGTDRITAVAMAGGLSPWVRRWRTVETVTVTTRTGESFEHEVVTWHQELATDALVTYSNTRDVDDTATRPRDLGMVPILHDDQVGLVPPRAWVRSWARRWREELDHHQRPVRYARSWDKSAEAANRYVRDHLAGQERERIAATLLGIRGRQPVADRPDDPLDERWRGRFGDPPAGHTFTHDLGYLRRWLPVACEQDLDVGEFAGQLRALSEELARVLGDQPDQHWLGRCPSTLTNKETGSIRICGAGIWQDPYASQVTCLRCRSTWGPAKADLISLAVAIREAWPVDRRRRYTANELHFLPPINCPGCVGRVSIEWKEVTGRGEKVRTWQPVAASCPLGCDTTRLL